MDIFTEKYKEKRKFIIKLLITSLLIGGSVVRSQTLNTPINQSVCPSPICDDKD